MALPNVYLLASDNHPSLLPLLRSQPTLASSQDEHGYSVLHAAISYNHLDLARTLVHEFHVDVDIIDEDGESPLFSTEAISAARLLVEELGADRKLRNLEGQTAAEKIEADEDFPDVAAYLKELELQDNAGTSNVSNDSTTADAATEAVLPEGMSIRVGTMDASDIEGEGIVDPELKRRIEELATRDDFQGEEGQRQLRELVSDAVKEHLDTTEDRTSRRRLD